MIRVLVVDDHELIRLSFSDLISGQPDMEVVGQAATGVEAIEQAFATSPDVVLMDIRMPGVDGIQATARITAEPRLASTRIVMLTTFDLDQYVYGALEAGASGFLLKDAAPAQLLEAIRVVAAGEALIAPSITRRLIADFSARPDPEAAPELRLLTDREREVFVLIAHGLANREIAAELFVGETTVKTHVKRILMKLELRDRVHAVVFAYETGLLSPGSAG